MSQTSFQWNFIRHLGRVKRIWYLSPMRAAKVQASLRIRAVSPEPPLLAHTSSESRGTFRQKARSLAHLYGWACAVKICHDGMLEDTKSLDAAHLVIMAFKVLEYSFAFKRHCNVWLLETLAIRVKTYQRNILYASIIRQLFKLCFHVTDLFLHTEHSTSYFGIQNPHRQYIRLLTLWY